MSATASNISIPAVSNLQVERPMSLLRQLGSSRRAIIGGAGLLIILLTCVSSLYWTARPETDSPLYFNKQHGDLARLPPSFTGKPANEPDDDWAQMQQKIRSYDAAHKEGSLWRLFGTDGQSASMLGKCLYGGVISLSIGIMSAIISLILGVSIGMIAGYRGGWVDSVLMRFVDVMYGLPYILIVILFRSAFADAEFNKKYPIVLLFVSMGLVSWLTMARVIRGQVLSLRTLPYVEAARAAGVPEYKIFLHHLLPNLIGPIIVYATLTIPAAILQESFLSFLGLGVSAPTVTWGSLASEGLTPGLNSVHSRWWLLFFPCTLLASTLLCLNFLGDGLRDIFDPRKEAAKI